MTQKRTKKRILVQLAEDNVELLDDCARKLGVSRSVLLQLVIDGFREHIVTYTEGLMRGYYFSREFEGIRQTNMKDKKKT